MKRPARPTDTPAAGHYIVVAGNIGVGKSSFTELYATNTGAVPVREAVAENPYLDDFYRDMSRWGFHSQMFFLGHRACQHAGLISETRTIIQDRSLYEDAEVFAYNLYVQGHLSGRDWFTYRQLYDSYCRSLRPPDLVVYLRADVSTLTERIAKRGRDFERAIDPGYLEALNRRYDEWIATFGLAPVVNVDTDGMDFVTDERDYQRIANVIARALPDPASGGRN